MQNCVNEIPLYCGFLRYSYVKYMYSLWFCDWRSCLCHCCKAGFMSGLKYGAFTGNMHILFYASPVPLCVGEQHLAWVKICFPSGWGLYHRWRSDCTHHTKGFNAYEKTWGSWKLNRKGCRAYIIICGFVLLVVAV